jgi:tetratricopeptide (TPR) repeat protein
LKRKLTLRLLAVLIGLLPFILLEIGLRISGAGAGDDPLSGFNQRIALFERDGGIYRTARAREPFFPHQEFAASKPTNSFRIFCFGGSTVHGHPYQSETAFPRWLELELGAADRNRAFQAVNCGGVSYASYRLAPLVKEVVSYQPDLIIVATGENEFLEDRTYQSLKTRSALRRWLEDALQSLRIVTVARELVPHRKPRPSEPVDSGNDALGQEVQTRLDSPGGYASYHRDDAWHDRVASQYEESLRDMVTTCRGAKVPLLLVKLGSNLRDCPPYKSEHRTGLSAEEERTWQDLFDAASRLEDEKPEQALEAYCKVEKIDRQHALLQFRIARLLDRQREKQTALEYYGRARDEDICPLRLPSRHEEILTRVSQQTQTPLVDVAAVIAGRSMDKVPGNDWYVDHVHPNIGGHQLMAMAMAARLRELRIAAGSHSWTDSERQAAYTTELNKLGPAYLAQGLHRVQWLEHWARRERLFDEAQPRDAGAFLRAAFRHLELGQEEDARKELTEALSRDRNLADEVRRYAERFVAEGRPTAAARLSEWLDSVVAGADAAPKP